MSQTFDMLELMKRPPSSLTVEEMRFVIEQESKGGVIPGELPLHLAAKREQALDSPSFFVTEIVDEYYKENFERVHYMALDEVLGPYMLGETVRIDGVNHDPTDYLGILIEFSRDTFKSSMLKWLLCWAFVYWKLRLKRDARAMYVHQVLDKAIKAGDSIRNCARMNKEFRAIFPEFKGPQGEWDTKQEWRWPNFTSFSAGEFSFTAYGETSDKTGGHYPIRVIDDWETEGSVTTEAMLESSYSNFRAMDPLKDRTARTADGREKFCPMVVAGTTYHFQGVYKRIEKDGGYLIWRIPAHRGSPKALFDLCSIDNRTEKGRDKIKAGIDELEKTRHDDLNFPKRLDWRELYQNARAQGPHIFNCQMLLNPVPEGEQRFDQEALDASLVDKIPSPGESWAYIRCDPAISEKKSSDETAIVVGLIKWDGTRWLVDGWLGREKRPTEIIKKWFTLARKWQEKGYKVKSIGCESVQYQEGLAQIARDGVPERKAAYHGESVPVLTKPCPVLSIKRSPDMRKHERILEMDGPVTRRELKVWKQCPIGDRILLQFKNFPFDKDDALDAVHDLWVMTMTPPPVMPDTLPEIHPLIKQIMRKHLDRRPGLLRASAPVRLAAWG